MQQAWSLEQLNTFRAVVNAGSFTRAAEDLALSQPAVSIQVRALEKAVGARLLERRPRQLLLTDAGRIVLRYAHHMAEMASACRAEIADLGKLTSGLLRVGAGATPSIFTLAGVFAEYYRRWPGIELRVEISRTADLIQKVMDDALDMAIISSDCPPPEMISQAIYSESCVVIASTTHEMARSDQVDVADLAKHPIVMLQAGSGFRRYVEVALARQGVDLDIEMELASLEAIKEVVRTGVLASIVPETAAADESPASGIQVIQIAGAELMRQTLAVRRTDKYVSKAMKAFYRLLEEKWPEKTASSEQGRGVGQAREALSESSGR